jgi:dipeptidyl aminopeptidase/acylaminoacyl peptidase
LITTVEANEEWRRSIQRSEFGDERDPKVRDFMKRTAPLNNANRLKTPLFIIQGKNDPRVPYQESESLVKAAQKSGVPVWYLAATDEGHGFVKQANYEFRMCSLVLFVKERLLK